MSSTAPASVGLVPPVVRNKGATFMEPLCTYSLYPCTRLRLAQYPYCTVHLYEQSQNQKSSSTSCQHHGVVRCEYTLAGSVCSQTVQLPSRFCSAHDPDVVAISINQESSNDTPTSSTAAEILRDLRRSLTCLATSSQTEYTMTQANETHPLQLVHIKDHTLPPDEMREVDLAVLTDSDSETEDADTFPYTSEFVTSPEVVAATKRSLELLRDAYRDELLRLHQEMRLSYEQCNTTNKLSTSLRGHTVKSRSRKSIFAHCHNYSWTERWLRHKATEKRYQAAYIESTKFSAIKRCSHQGVLKCYERCLPLSQYCSKHILDESQQVLYQKCAHESCNLPVLKLSANESCHIHSDLSHLKLPTSVLEEVEEKMKEEMPYEVLPPVEVLSPIKDEFVAPKEVSPKKHNASFTNLAEMDFSDIQLGNMLPSDMDALLRAPVELHNLLNTSQFSLQDEDMTEENPVSIDKNLEEQPNVAAPSEQPAEQQQPMEELPNIEVSEVMDDLTAVVETMDECPVVTKENENAIAVSSNNKVDDVVEALMMLTGTTTTASTESTVTPTTSTDLNLPNTIVTNP